MGKSNVYKVKYIFENGVEAEFIFTYDNFSDGDVKSLSQPKVEWSTSNQAKRKECIPEYIGGCVPEIFQKVANHLNISLTYYEVTQGRLLQFHPETKEHK